MPPCPPILWQLEDDHLQSRDIAEVLHVRREQLEATLDCLCCKPEIVEAHVWVSSRLLEVCGEAAECLGCLHGDPQLRLSAEPAQHGRGSLLLRTRSQQLQAESDFGDVDGREIDRLLASDGVNVGCCES